MQGLFNKIGTVVLYRILFDVEILQPSLSVHLGHNNLNTTSFQKCLYTDTDLSRVLNCVLKLQLTRIVGK